MQNAHETVSSSCLAVWQHYAVCLEENAEESGVYRTNVKDGFRMSTMSKDTTHPTATSILRGHTEEYSSHLA